MERDIRERCEEALILLKRESMVTGRTVDIADIMAELDRLIAWGQLTTGQFR